MYTQAEYAHNKSWSGRGSLETLVSELKRQVESKIDVVIDTRQLILEPSPHEANSTTLVMCAKSGTQASEFLPTDGAPILPQALLQIGQRVAPNVPAKFLRELTEAEPTMAADLLNQLMWRQGGDRRLIRMLDGNVRAYLSNKYRCIDHYDILMEGLKTAQEHSAEVIEATLNERNMRVKFTTRDIWEAIDFTRTNTTGWYSGGLGNQEHLSKVCARSKGDLPGGPNTVHPLSCLSNSETGHGGVSGTSGILGAICFNLATVMKVVAQVHLGSAMDEGIFSEETRRAEGQVTLMKTRDLITSTFDPAQFSTVCKLAEGAASTEIEAPAPAVDHIISTTDLTEDARDDILSYFIKDYAPNAFGLAQAVARYAQDTPDSDAASTAEEVAGTLIKVPAMCVVPA